MKNLIKRFIHEEEGQDMVEYALLAALISIVAIVAVRSIGTAASVSFSTTASAITGS